MSGEDDPTSSEEVCGHPTQAGGLCSRPPLVGGEHCHQHAGLEATEAEQEASRRNPVEHGYYFSGFVDEQERAVFRAVADGRADLADIQRRVVAALVVRAVRMLKHEHEDPDMAGLTTGAFAELRKTLNALDSEALEIEYTFDVEEVRRYVQGILNDDPELAARLIHSENHDELREALD